MKKIHLCKYEDCIYLSPTRPFLAPESVMSLPPLDCLRFFEAAARLRSFAHAGKELGVTPPAVAHRIRMLESHLGAELFERGRRSVRLNRRTLLDFQGGLAVANKGLSMRKVREVLRLHHVAGLSGRAIARSLKVSPVTVKEHRRKRGLDVGSRLRLTRPTARNGPVAAFSHH